MRPEHLYLLDIVEAAGNVALHMAGLDREGFSGNVTARAAVLHELTVIGEGAARQPRPPTRCPPRVLFGIGSPSNLGAPDAAYVAGSQPPGPRSCRRT